jgi:hypothetical protein
LTRELLKGWVKKLNKRKATSILSQLIKMLIDMPDTILDLLLNQFIRIDKLSD